MTVIYPITKAITNYNILMDKTKSYNIIGSISMYNIDGHVCKAFLSSTNLYSEGEDRRRGGKESYTCRPMIMLCSLAGVNILWMVIM